MIEPWVVVARLAVALAAQPDFAFHVRKAVGVTECRAELSVQDLAARARAAQADADFMRWVPEPETGNPRF